MLLASPGLSAADQGELTVFGAASLRDALGATVRAFEQETGVEVKTSFASSGILARQIDAGAPANVYLSANPKWMDYLAQRGRLVSGSRFDLLANRIVLIAPNNSQAQLTIKPGFDLATSLGDGRLAMGNPAHVPAGSYAKAALQNLGIWSAVEPKVAFADNVRSALALVTRAGAPLGIVYRTDAMASDGVRLVDTFPADSHPPIVYPAARVRSAQSAASTASAAKRFLAFLKTDRARRIFERFGFDYGSGTAG